MASRLFHTSSSLFQNTQPLIYIRTPLNLSIKTSSCRSFFIVRNHAQRNISRWNINNNVSLSYPLCNCRSFSSQSILENVLEELANKLYTKRKKPQKCSHSISNSVILAASQGIINTGVESNAIQKGLLIEFRKDSERKLLAVAMKPDGKKNWMVSDQNGIACSIRPQQITFIVPGAENFEHARISAFINKANELLDHSLLKFAWEEVLEKNKLVKAEDLAEIIFGKSGALESYCAHVLLSQDETYFSVRDTRGYSPLYEPRPIKQVEELSQKKKVKQAYWEDVDMFISKLRSAIDQPIHSKPQKGSWQSDKKTHSRIKALEAFALDMWRSDEEKKVATEILKRMGLSRTSTAAVDLLIKIGYFPVHVNLELLKFEIPIEPSQIALNAVEEIFKLPPDDPDQKIRKDLTNLKVYAIDVDEADELDDALSATQLPDGRIKIWIHVADPTRWVEPGSILNREAKSKATSIFLPTATYPMFPVELAMEKMSLKQGKVCPAVSVSVVLNHDGSMAESHVENSTVIPTYMMTYEGASELLALNIDEEPELNLLAKAATLRSSWRQNQGSIDSSSNLEPRIKVHNADDPEPLINLYVQDQSSPAVKLVTELMILCGEVIAEFGRKNNIPLPYRGHTQSKISNALLSYLPEGPARTSLLSKTLRAVEMDFKKPLYHGRLGVTGYVQFTSPIRRYVDLLAHYQVKAVLRGQTPPFLSAQLEGVMPTLNMRSKIAKRLYSNSLQYWLLEYLRRQPMERKYQAKVLKFVKDRFASLLLLEIGMTGSVEVTSDAKVGHTIFVTVDEANPRKEILLLKEVR